MLTWEAIPTSSWALFGILFCVLIVVNFFPNTSATKQDVPLASGGLPLIGHSIPFLRDACSLCFDKKNKYGSIYALNIAGTKFNIITDVVSGINFFFRNEKTFLAEYFHHRFNKYVTMWSDKFNGELEFRELLRVNSSKILKSTSGIDELVSRFRNCYISQLESKFPSNKSVELDLFHLCKKTMFKASCFAVFGKDFPCDAMFDDYSKFEASISYFMKGYPRLIDQAGFKARDNVFKHLMEFFEDPSKTSGASQLVLAHLKSFELQSESNSVENKASYFMGILFASASNVVPAAFWIVAHILSTPGLTEKVREIIAPCYDAESDTFEWEVLFTDELLRSLISETLRLHSNITNARLVTEDTEMIIGEKKEKKVVKKGEVLLLVSDLVHWDESVYPDPFTWNPERFLPNNEGILIRGEKNWKTYVPWGGGLHMCSGRFFAMNEMVIQLTLMIWYFNIDLIDEIPEPYIKERFGLGVANPSSEMRVRITRRDKSVLAEDKK